MRLASLWGGLALGTKKGEWSEGEVWGQGLSSLDAVFLGFLADSG